jgi:hypothetical protein
MSTNIEFKVNISFKQLKFKISLKDERCRKPGVSRHITAIL